MNAHATIPDNCPALVLNADFRPLSYYPLSLWSWQETVKAVFLDRVNIVSEYDRFVRSPTLEMRLPSVVSLKTYVRPALYPAFTRFNVFLRDRFTCQYCGDRSDLTFDHLIPRSRGGLTRWDNVVTACAPCNLAKGGYVLADAKDGKPEVILIGTGSEVPLCVEAYEKLTAEGVATRVVSLPSWELFAKQTQEYRDSVLPPTVRARVTVEMGTTQGWERFAGLDGAVIGMTTFGASAPLKDLLKHFDFTVERVYRTAKGLLAKK